MISLRISEIGEILYFQFPNGFSQYTDLLQYATIGINPFQFPNGFSPGNLVLIPARARRRTFNSLTDSHLQKLYHILAYI